MVRVAMRVLDLPESGIWGGVEVECQGQCLTGNVSPSSQRMMSADEALMWNVALPEMEAPHLGVSLRRGGNGWWACHTCRKQLAAQSAPCPPHCKLLFRSVATISRKKKELE